MFFFIGCSRTDILFVLLLIERVIKSVSALETCEFCVFNNDGYEFEYESECRYYCEILLSMIVDAANSTTASTVIFDPIGAGLHEFDGLEYIFCVLSTKDGFDCEINIAFKYWCDKILMVIMIVLYFLHQLGMLQFFIF